MNNAKGAPKGKYYIWLNHTIPNFTLFMRLMQVDFLRNPDDSSLVFKSEEVDVMIALFEESTVDYSDELDD